MDKSGVPKEAQDDALSDGMSGGRQTPPGRPTRGNAALTTVFFLAALLGNSGGEGGDFDFFSKCRTSEKPVIILTEISTVEVREFPIVRENNCRKWVTLS